MFIETKHFQGPHQKVEVTLQQLSLEGTRGPAEVVNISGTLSRRSGGVALAGHLTTVVSLPCARCDGDFDQQLEIDFNLLFTDKPDVSAASEEIFTEESALGPALDEKRRIDLMALSREQIYLALPLKPICKEECLGLCATCGIDFNLEHCTCRRNETDPRWAALENLRTQQ